MKNAILTIIVIAFAATVSFAQGARFSRPPRKFCKEYRWYHGCFPVLMPLNQEVNLAGALNVVGADTPKDTKKKKKQEGKKGEKINIPIFEAVIDGQEETAPKKPVVRKRRINVAVYDRAGHICESKPWICFPDPKPPKKKKLGPKTKVADDNHNSRPASPQAVYTYGIRKRRRIAQSLESHSGQECRPPKPTGTARPRPTRPFGPKTKVFAEILRSASRDISILYATGGPLPPKVIRERPRPKEKPPTGCGYNGCTGFAGG